MSTDESYTSFLEQANQDPGQNQTSSSKDSWPDLLPLSTKANSIPKKLRSVNAVYVSETDEEFEPVSIELEGKLGVEEFQKLISSKASDVEELSVKEFDPKGKYSEVFDAVKGVVDDGEVKVFRVEVGRAKVWYFVLGKDGDKAVGFRVKAVES